MNFGFNLNKLFCRETYRGISPGSTCKFSDLPAYMVWIINSAIYALNFLNEKFSGLRRFDYVLMTRTVNHSSIINLIHIPLPV